MGTNSFSWGFPEEQQIQSMSTYMPDAQIQESLRLTQNASTFPLQTASPKAQNATGLGIQNVRRGFLDIRVQYDSTVVGIDFQTSSTTFTDVSSELMGTMVSSGRPVMIVVRGTSTGDPCTFTVRIDGDEVTGVSAGITTSSKGDGIWFATPSSGGHLYALQWKVATGTAIMPRSYRPALTVVEI